MFSVLFGFGGSLVIEKHRRRKVELMSAAEPGLADPLRDGEWLPSPMAGLGVPWDMQTEIKFLFTFIFLFKFVFI